MIVIGRRLMRMRVEAGLAEARANEEEARGKVREAERESKDAKGSPEPPRAEKRLRAATDVLNKACNEVERYAVRKEEHVNEAELARKRGRMKAPRVVQYGEFGDKLCPFTEYGKNYIMGSFALCISALVSRGSVCRRLDRTFFGPFT